MANPMDLLNGLKDKQNANNSGLISIKLDQITALEQVRSSSNVGFETVDLGAENNDKSVDSLTALANNIRENGLINPITVRPKHVDNDLTKAIIPNEYVIVSGERRFRATKEIRKWQLAEQENNTARENDKLVDSILCIVKNFDSELAIDLEQLSENIQRTELQPFEIAFSLNKIENSIKETNPSIVKANGDVPRSYLAKITGKTEFWISQMRSFSDLANDMTEKAQQLVSYFKDGTISSSPRSGNNLIVLFRKSDEDIKQYILDFVENCKNTNRLVDRKVVAELQELIDQKLNANSNVNTDEDIPNLNIASMNSEESSNDTTDTNNSKVGEIDYLDSESEYTENQEREHTENVTFAPKNQENTAPTAGIGKPSYTDADTHVTHDLSDRIKDDNSNFNQNDDYSVPTLKSIRVEFEGNEWDLILTDEDSLDSNVDGKLVSLDGTETITAPLSELKLLSFNLL